MTRPLALATCAELPVEADEAALEAALDRAEIPYRWAVWDDGAEDWSSYGGVLIRTTWDYIDRPEAFRRWARTVARATSLWNPAPLVVWNSHKRYLVELATDAVAVVPTTVVAAGEVVPDEVLEPGGGGAGLVVKPAESVGSVGLSRWSEDAAGRAGARAAIRALHDAGQDVLVQPLVPAIATTGERSLVVIDGEVTHAVRKVPVPGDIRSQPEFGSDVAAVEPTDDERDLAGSAIEAAAGRTGVDPASIVYARVDLVEHQGEPHLMELEVIEPDLYYSFGPASAERLAAAVASRLARS